MPHPLVRTLLGTAAICLLPVGQAFAGECVRVAPGSYSADRSVSGPDGSQSMKVYVSGSKRREEGPGQFGPEVRIVEGTGRAVVAFNPENKIGMRLPPPPNARRKDIKVSAKDQGDGTMLLTMTADVNGQVEQISQMTCRKDGVLIEARHNLPDAQGHSKGTLVIRDSNVVVGPQPASLFQVPGGLKYAR
jgi:hypothetical protein